MKTVEKYWKRLKQNCNHKYDSNGDKVDRLLSLSEVQSLLDAAGITIDDVGNKRGQYQLSRYNDIGHYSLGNCRFITMEENLKERKEKRWSKEMREHMSNKAKENWASGKQTGSTGKTWEMPDYWTPELRETRSKAAKKQHQMGRFSKCLSPKGG